MKKRILSSALIVTIVLLSGCGGGGGSSGSTGDPTSITSATLSQGSTGIGALFADDAGNSIVSLMATAGADDVGTLLADFADGSQASATVQGGVPTSVTDGSTTATFSNWSGTTVDVTITGGGETETVNVDYSQYVSSINASKGWPQFFGATWTTLTVAFCPVSIALSAVSIGAGLPAAIVGCTLAGTNLYRLLNGQPTLVEAVATYATAPASCAAVAAGDNTQAQQCVSDALTTLPSTAAYVNEYGEIVTDGDGGGGTFAGSCTIPAGYDCINYTESEMSAAEAQAICEAGGGIYSSGACSTAGIVGTCTVGAGTGEETVTVFYAPYTTEIARAACDAAGGVFTAQ